MPDDGAAHTLADDQTKTWPAEYQGRRASFWSTIRDVDHEVASAGAATGTNHAVKISRIVQSILLRQHPSAYAPRGD
jgi:hypothetical protein